MEADITRFSQICSDLAGVEMGLMEGKIDFNYDNLMSATKPGHPCEMMDDILSAIYYPSVQGKEPPMKTMEATLKKLQKFAKTFQIKEMDDPLKALSDYIKDRKS